MLDAFGRILIELREDAGVLALTDRIRGHEPGPEDAKGPGEYQRFVVLIDLGRTRGRRGLPIQYPSYICRAYGTTYADATALANACSDAIHDVGQRVHANGLGIYASHDAGGGGEGFDPRTHQPYQEFVIELVTTTAIVAA